jgi:hypothetical protein
VDLPIGEQSVSSSPLKQKCTCWIFWALGIFCLIRMFLYTEVPGTCYTTLTRYIILKKYGELLFLLWRRAIIVVAEVGHTGIACPHD